MPRPTRGESSTTSPTPPASAPVQHRANGGAAYDEDLPDLGTRTARQGDPWPKVQACSAFYLVVVPDRWTVIEGHVVPAAHKLSLSPGANGVARGAGGKPDPVDALASTERDGAYVIPWDIDGPRTSYLRSYQVGEAVDRKTGAPVKIRHWCTRWETLFAGSEHVQSDAEGYAAWLERLIGEGRLRPPAAHVIERLRGQYLEHLGAALRNQHPENEARARKALAGIEAAWSRWGERVQAVPETGAPEVA
jgi:hypothetical protein